MRRFLKAILIFVLTLLNSVDCFTQQLKPNFSGYRKIFRARIKHSNKEDIAIYPIQDWWAANDDSAYYKADTVTLYLSKSYGEFAKKYKYNWLERKLMFQEEDGYISAHAYSEKKLEYIFKLVSVMESRFGKGEKLISIKLARQKWVL